MKRAHALIAPCRLAANTSIAPDVHLRTRPLALCLVAALAGHAGVSDAAPHAVAHIPLPGMAMPSAPTHATAQTWTVKNCNDSGAGSLRDIVENPMNAQTGDVVDLSQLPMSCGTMDSTITLSSGEIAIIQQDLTLKGPSDAAQGTVTVSGGHASRVFNHEGTGRLALYSLRIRDGLDHEMGAAAGGCITSLGNVYIQETSVSSCQATSDSNIAHGGAIYSAGDTMLVLSTISDSHADATQFFSRGGGVHVRGNFLAKYGSISDNSISGDSGHQQHGAGVYAEGDVTILGSTLAGNTANNDSALVARNATATVLISSSTISGNVATDCQAMYLQTSSVLISNSTIAFNSDGWDCPAVRFKPQGSGTLILQSSIIAGNTSGAAPPSDLYLMQGATLSGSNNLVMASNVSPPNVITVTADPQLGPLQFNGGRTLTHALLPSSPAIGMGNNSANRLYDQRGACYPRTTGAAMSTDIGAFQFDSIFANGAEW